MKITASTEPLEAEAVVLDTSDHKWLRNSEGTWDCYFNDNDDELPSATPPPPPLNKDDTYTSWSWERLTDRYPTLRLTFRPRELKYTTTYEVGDKLWTDADADLLPTDAIVKIGSAVAIKTADNDWLVTGSVDTMRSWSLVYPIVIVSLP